MIKLRDVVDTDCDMVREWRNLPHISRHMFTSHKIGIDEHNRWFARALTDQSRKDWIIMFGERPVGLVTVSEIDLENSRAKWAFYVADPKLPGIGAIAEYRTLQYVFNEMGLHKLAGDVLATNTGTISVHEKFGFAIDGTLRDERRKDGEFVDVVCMSILEHEWKAIEPEMRTTLRM